MTTPRLGAPELPTGQNASPETMNELGRWIEQGASLFIVKDKDENDPPGSPTAGDCYIVAASATGAWTGWETRLAFRLSSSWEDITPIEGTMAYVQDEDLLYQFDGSAWAAFSTSGGAYEPGGTDVALEDGGTGASLADPGADRIMFWDDSAGSVDWLQAGSNITISGTTISSAGGTGGVPTLIETLSPSAAATADSEAFAGGGWALVIFVLDLTVSVDNASIQMLYKLNGTYKNDGNYRRRASGTTSSGSSDSADSNTGTALIATLGTANFGVGNDTLESFTSEVHLLYPDGTTKPKRCRVESFYQGPTGSLIHFAAAGTYTGADAATALQGLRFQPSSGTFTGTIKVFGQQ